MTTMGISSIDEGNFPTITMPPWNVFKAFCTSSSGTGAVAKDSNRAVGIRQRKRSVTDTPATSVSSPWLWPGRSSNRRTNKKRPDYSSWTQFGNCKSNNMTPQNPCSETDFSCSSSSDETSEQQQEQTIVFDVDRGDNESSTSSGFVQTRDAYWDAILLSALTEGPVEQQEEEDYGDSSSDTSSVSGASSDDSSILSCSSLEDEDFEWTNLTKVPSVCQAAIKSPVKAEKKTTVLSDQLWNRDYDRVTARLQSHPEEAHQKIDLSVSGSTAHKNEKASQGLPLHLACAMRPLPPLSILERLLQANPEAAGQVDSKWGMLPLHFAVNLSNQEYDGGDGATIPSQAQMVHLLLSTYPAALNTKENYQARTPLHLAASTTPQSVNGKIPPASVSVLRVLIDQTPTMEALWETDMVGETAYDMARQASSTSPMTVCFAGVNWQVNPLLGLLSTTRGNTAQQQQQQQRRSLLKKAPPAEEERSHTDATSVTMSVSSGSLTEHDEQQQQDDDRYFFASARN